MNELTVDQKNLLDEIEDDQLESECVDRGIWPVECEECEECKECACEGFEEECEAIRQAFLFGRESLAVELSRKLVEAVTGKFI